jgi:hypothetical protein
MPVPVRMVILMLVAAFVLGLGLGGFTVNGANDGASDGANDGAGATPSGAATASPPVAGDLRLTAHAVQGPGGSVSISGGVSPARSGVQLVVQRLEGGRWRDFPAQTSTSGGGSYRLALRSGRKGEQAFRVVAPDADGRGAISNAVRITVA